MERERDEIRSILVANIQALDERVEEKWSETLSPDDERLQLSRLRTLSQLARQYRLLARDADVDEMEADVDLLRESLNAIEERE